MQEKTVTLADFPHTILPREQLAILKHMGKTPKLSNLFKLFKSKLLKLFKSNKQDDTLGGCFYPPEKSKSCTLIEYTGVVPEDVCFLADIGFLNPLNPDLDPIANDNITKTYIISQMGELYLCYIKNMKQRNYLPIVISIISLLFSLANILFQVLSSQQILQVQLLK